MRVINVQYFINNVLSVMEEVFSGVTVVLTQNGRRIARIEPIVGAKLDSARRAV